MTVAIAAISSEPLDVAAHLAAVADAHAGATASFVGTVRDHDPEADGTVTTLDYSAHPDAERVLARIAADLDRDGARLAVTHRIGTLDVGDLAIVAAVSTAHRAEAFDLCRELVERVKAELPVWKRQHTEDGTTHWVGMA
ncbi:molybdopterin biosynthesis protein MoeE [Pseudoclavibacter endophyticus]|uniref:Molybdenum cofactor biosynthesis protein MoaE n=1 Tax=Pseudoclavibacter endophyticus TaxID=1778590 RepID=A0A6H9WHS3_9MICO|nr:molybdenum cofactor biosynthesis protein MoaE [Pseudoclavibacter endophyticus]KAB1648843.1 molybdenum cofactor biosynthesis protein MoaE [Pseudoclavibacter endophyticus]GGA67883.1 molybdopterin biosynthesis protein MoeE [Pseudoclavibacter endophyticus]